MSLHGRNKPVVLGNVQLLRAGAKPGPDAAEGRRALDPLQPDDFAVKARSLLDATGRRDELDMVEREAQRFPRSACSRSIDSKRALKFPSPKVVAPCRSITSKKTVGRSWAVFVKICRR